MSAVPSAATAPRPTSPFAVVERMAWRDPAADPPAVRGDGARPGRVARRRRHRRRDRRLPERGDDRRGDDRRPRHRQRRHRVPHQPRRRRRRGRRHAASPAASRTRAPCALRRRPRSRPARALTDAGARRHRRRRRATSSALADGLVRLRRPRRDVAGELAPGVPRGLGLPEPGPGRWPTTCSCRRPTASGGPASSGWPEAANSVGGPVGALAIAVLVSPSPALVVSAAVIAGRTRRLTHPALLGATVVVARGARCGHRRHRAQSRELRAGGTTDIEAYVDANEAAFSVSNLRVTEICAVAARGSGAPLYEQFVHRAADLLDSLDEDAGRCAARATAWSATWATSRGRGHRPRRRQPRRGRASP